MKIANFIRAQEVRQFVDEAFGPNFNFALEGDDTIKQNDKETSTLKFDVAMIDLSDISEMTTAPDVLSEEDYYKKLKETFENLPNVADIRYWSVKYDYSRGYDLEKHKEIYSLSLSFTVRYTKK